MCDSEMVLQQMDNSGTVEPEQPQKTVTMDAQQHQLILKTMEDLAKDNHWLREKMKEITTDRDRLLCEVANLRLELDMMELRKLPDDNFPQKVNDRQSPATASYNAPNNTTLISTTGPVTSSGGGYIYLQQQQHFTPPQLCYQSINPSGINNGSSQAYVNGGQQQILYSTSGPFYSPVNTHHPHHHHSNVVVPSSMQYKKGSIRNNTDVLKRTRTQNAYELSQDLLEKQIELLERKYGGVRARNAAVTIQRAFRHYTMVKKFASITAMAKAEKRLSRRVLQPTVVGLPPVSSQDYYQAAVTTYTDEHGQVITSTYNDHEMLVQQPTQRVVATITAQSPAQQRMTPVSRSMSLRERRSLDASSPIVARNSQSGTTSPMPSAAQQQNTSSSTTTTPSSQQHHSHPHVNVLHQEQHYYSPVSGQYQQQAQFDTSGQMIDHSMNNSWNSHQQSPHTPYYSASQIYSRPRVNMSPASNQSTPSAIIQAKRTPPEVPKRTSSIITNSNSNLAGHRSGGSRPNGLCKTAENGSLSSVQSSGSDSSASTGDRCIIRDINLMDISNVSDRSNSPQWRRNGSGKSNQQLALNQQMIIQSPDHQILHQNHHLINNNPITIVDQMDNHHLVSSHTSAAQYSMEQNEHLLTSQVIMTPATKVSETIRKRQYRVGLNLFNKKPEKGIAYLIKRGFLEQSAQGVARFLISRKGLSRQMIGEYLGNLQNQFNMAVLECFANELDLCGMQVDVALRKFQAYFRMPGEAQKIERLMEIFSQRYCQCNSDIVARLRSTDTVFVLAFAIIMLNTDLHTPNLKPERRMRIDDFIKNLRGIDDCHDIDTDLLMGIYERVKANEFKPGSDHVTQVMKVQATIVGKKPNLALPHRRLVCYCRLYEIPDINKKERPGVHQREVFLFNDLLVITKIFSKKKTSVTYTFRNSYPLCGMVVTLLDVPNYPYCIRLSQKVDGKVLVTFNARNEHDRCKFAEDLRESISEMDEMEQLRIESELERQKTVRAPNRGNGNTENRDSGVADIEVCTYQSSTASSPNNNTNVLMIANGTAAGTMIMDNGNLIMASEHYQHQYHHQNGENNNNQMLKRSALSNSLLDMHEFGSDKPQRRGSVGSLDSGMSISFQSTSVASSSGGSRNETKMNRQPNPQQIQQQQQFIAMQQQQQQQHQQQGGAGQGFLGGIFHKRERKLSRTEDVAALAGNVNINNSSSSNSLNNNTNLISTSNGNINTSGGVGGAPSTVGGNGRSTEV